MRLHCGIRQRMMPDFIPIKDDGKQFLSYVGTRGEHAIARDEICAVLHGFVAVCDVLLARVKEKFS